MNVSTADATHFHGATLHTTRVPYNNNPTVQDRVKVVFESSWRSSFGWAGPIAVGSTFSSGYSLTISNSMGVAQQTNAIIWTIVAINPAEDLFTARFEIDVITSDKMAIQIDHQGGDRDSILAEGNHDKSWRIYAESASLASVPSGRSPRAVSLPRVYVNATQVSNMSIPVVVPAPYTATFGLSPLTMSSLASARPVGSAACFQTGPAAGPLVPSPPVNGASAPCNCGSPPLVGVCAPAMNISQITDAGVWSWTPAIPARYGVQFEAIAVDSNFLQRGRVPLDMVVAVVAPCPGAAGAGCIPPPTVTVPATYLATPGTALSIPVTASSPVASGQTLYLFNTPLPAGASLASTSGPGPTFATTLNWTPTFANEGVYPVCFQVTAADVSMSAKATSLGQQCVKITVPGPNVPDAPTNVAAARGNGAVTVTLTPPASNGGAAISGYKLTSNPAGGVDTASGTLTLPRSVVNLTNGTAYTFTAVATNSAGDSVPSAPSNSVTPATVAQAPFISFSSGGDGRVSFNIFENTGAGGNGGSAVTGLTLISSPAGGVDNNAGTTATAHLMTGLTNGTAYTFRATATNDVGTSAHSAPSTSVTPNPSKPTIVKTFDTSPIVIGQPSLLSITLTNPNPVSTLAGLAFTDTLPTGVRATAGSQSACGGTVTITTGAITLAGGSLAAGSNCVIAVSVTGAAASATAWNNTISNVTSTTATFPGPNPSTSANITVNKAATTVVINSTTPAAPVFGQSYAVTFTLAVASPGAGTPGGTVTISDGTNSCAATLPATSCSLVGTPVGVASLTASYTGDTRFLASMSTSFPQTVAPAATTTAIVSDTPDPSAAATPVLVTTSLGVVAPGAGTPGGSITVGDGVDSCTIMLPATSCTWTPTTVGTRSLTAVYSGDGRFASSTATTAPHTVVPAGQQSPLTVSRAGSGSGGVTSGDGVINCGTACSNVYAHTTGLTLTATAEPGSTFSGWLGACTGKLPCALVITAPAAVSATFAPNAPPLNLDIDGNANVDLLSDGLLLVRYLSLLPDEVLVAGAIGGGTAVRITATDVRQYLANMKPILDIDGDGAVDMATDGVLLLRYLSGLRGDALLAGVTLGAGARRTLVLDIESYLAGLYPGP